MPGGEAAIRQPWRMAATYLDAAFAGSPPDGLDVARRNRRRWPHVLNLARRGLNSPVTSSAGRLFDAVAAILGVRDAINYEGQAAVELEQLADPRRAGRLPRLDHGTGQHETSRHPVGQHGVGHRGVGQHGVCHRGGGTAARCGR